MIINLETAMGVKYIAEHKWQSFYDLETKAGAVRIRVTKAGKIFTTVGGKQIRIL